MCIRDSGARALSDGVRTTARRGRLGLGEAVAVGEGGAYRLTAREDEILALVAQGRTDRQIGAELFISHRTVERHVSNMLAKLGAATRAEAVAIAYREGLVSVP